MTHYWGEIPGPAGAPPSRSSFELLQREFRSVEMQDPPLHQPSAQRPRPTTMLDIPSEPCSLTIHTVQLCQHVRRLRALLTAAQAQGQSSTPSEGCNRLEEADPNLPLRPPTPPAMPDDLLPADSKAPRQPFQLRHSDPESNFYKGESEPVTELSWPSCRQLLYQSVATVLAHAGFESAHESVLETLTDLVHEHYLRLTFLLRTAVDREARLGASPFPDVVEQVFHEMGIGSMLALQRFWQVRIKDYHSYMMRKKRTEERGLLETRGTDERGRRGVSKDLSEEYERLVNPEKALEDSKPLNIKEEPMSDIAFPVSEEPEADLASGDQALPMGVLGAHTDRLASGLDADHSPRTSGAGAASGSPLWSHVKMEPQDEEVHGSGHHHPHHHGVLGGDVFDEGEPMSTMSESGGAMAPSPVGGASDASYGSHSPDSLMGTSPVFNQRPKKRAKKM
ncbi:STAGA complex 65 subunit gamma isoform X1 [Oryzias melastigma]|uniref:STAGA complex 65 subunit gamma isoform X1 n=1 Tax=Oryzias melastigma TaxID=30732 RepID=UPI000CF7BBD2|nr:STAGA complex 65 subunit gamma isoform X1 [Oryzias melastigma]XP_024116245.1 STAGA complex 65 subunit gamma isoform X1 [Oryzias melastigma]